MTLLMLSLRFSLADWESLEAMEALSAFLLFKSSFMNRVIPMPSKNIPRQKPSPHAV